MAGNPGNRSRISRKHATKQKGVPAKPERPGLRALTAGGCSFCLEEDLQHESQLPRIAREELTRLIEGTVRRFRESTLKARETDRSNVVQITTDILGVVENVSRRRAELDPEPLVDRDSLQGR